MNSAKEIAEKYFPKDPHDQQLLELDILRLMERGTRQKWGAVLQEHAHQWEPELLDSSQITSSGGQVLICRICGQRKNKYANW